jgi:hypothetical protein
LDLSVTRDSDEEWAFSTQTDTTWSFHSEPMQEESVLPLLSVDYDIPVGLTNTVTAGSQSRVGFTITAPTGAAAGPVTAAQAWTSYDGGLSWQELSLRSVGEGEFTARVKQPSAVGPVALRVQATDADGNSVEQTVLAAYGIAGR